MDKPQYLKLEQQALHDWAFNRPPEWEFFDRRLDKAEAFEREGDSEKAIEVCFEIINSCPEYLPARNQLGLWFKEKGDLDRAIPMFESSVAIGLACFPDGFKPGTDLIQSHWADNRAFLWAGENLGLCCLEKALETYEFVSELNPDYDDEFVHKLRELLGREDGDIERRKVNENEKN